MKETNFEDMLSETIKMDKKAGPCKWFAFKMRLRLHRKAWQMGWHEAMSGTGKIKFAGISALAVILTCGGGVGVYAYSSPDVTVMHPLYPIKQGLESTEIYFAPTPRTKAEVQLKHAGRRMEEMKNIGEISRQNGGGRQADEEGMNKTMLIVRKQMNDSLTYAADEDGLDEAKVVIDSLQIKMQDLDTSLGEISRSDIANERQAIKANMEDLRQYTKLKMKKINQVSGQMSSPMRIKGPRVIMKRLTDDGQELEVDVPVLAQPVAEFHIQQVERGGLASSDPEVQVSPDSALESSAENPVERVEPVEAGGQVETGGIQLRFED